MSELTPEAKKAIRGYVMQWALGILTALGLGNVAAWYSLWPNLVKAATNKAETAGTEAGKEAVSEKAGQILAQLEAQRLLIEGAITLIQGQTNGVADSLSELVKRKGQLESGISTQLRRLSELESQITTLVEQTTKLTGDNAKQRLSQLEALATAMNANGELQQITSLAGQVTEAHRRIVDVAAQTTTTYAGLNQRVDTLEAYFRGDKRNLIGAVLSQQEFVERVLNPITSTTRYITQLEQRFAGMGYALNYVGSILEQGLLIAESKRREGASVNDRSGAAVDTMRSLYAVDGNQSFELINHYRFEVMKDPRVEPLSLVLR